MKGACRECGKRFGHGFCCPMTRAGSLTREEKMMKICQFPVAHREVNLAVEDGERPDWYDVGPLKPGEICEVCGLPTADTAP